MSEGTSATREVLDTATRITEAVDAAGLRVDHALKDSARRGALVRELTLFAERTTNDQLDRIGKMPDVAEYASVGDGSVSDMVTGLIGGKASAEADVEMLRTDLDIMTKRAEDAESMAKLNVQYGPKVAVLEKERDGLIIKVGTCEQAAGEIIAERDGLLVTEGCWKDFQAMCREVGAPKSSPGGIIGWCKEHIGINRSKREEQRPMTRTIVDVTDFRRELTQALNRASAENGSNTPDWILAEYLLGCLQNFDDATRAREKWFGHELRVGGKSGPIEEPAEAKQ